MIVVEVNKEDLRRVQTALGKIGKDAPKVICRAINKTASKSKTSLTEKARSVYTVKSGKFKSNMNIKRATYSRLEAEVLAHGKPLSITSFKTTAPKSGAKANIVKGNGLKVLDLGGIKAFKGRGKLNGQIYQRRGKSRFPIKKLSSNSVPIMIGNEKVYGQIKPQIESDLQKNIEAQIKFLLSSAG